ncbi:MAG: hypothetical protein APF84_14510 [Gracilibacter sp. BRH_c7a]|nr:MAG: hypothetical protein APF84_14510 [Gracilibacter sp. BRH_c7a]
MLKWLLLAIIVIHGLIHIMGGVNELGITKIQELSGRTLFTIPSNLQMVLGVLWLVAVVLFFIAAFGLVTNQQWWRSAVLIAVTVSQILVIIWWPDAKFGTIANGLIILGLALYE